MMATRLILGSRLPGVCVLGPMLIFSCNPIFGINEKSCDVCASETSRLVCADDGVHEEPCPPLADPCARAVCRGANQCEYEPNAGAVCGPPEAPGQCNEQGVCVGSRLALSAMEEETCALLQDGSVWCWGGNDDGELGDGTHQFRTYPTRVQNLPPSVAIGVGNAHVCAVTTARDLYCWGNSQAGQLDGGIRDSVSLPIRVPIDGVEFSQVTGGAGFVCALATSDDVYCWGYNNQGQCGQDPSTGTLLVRPNTTPVLQNVYVVMSTTDHTCALLRNGELYCWGRNVEGQLGIDPTTTPYSATPVRISLPVTEPQNIATIGVSWRSSYAATSTGALFAWGSNLDGQLGTGSTEILDPTPRLVMFEPEFGLVQPMDRGVVELFRNNGSHMCAKTSELVPFLPPYVCWGADTWGELGLGQNTILGQRHRTAAAARLLPRDARGATWGADHGCLIDPTDQIRCWGKTPLVGIGGPDDTVRVPATLELVEAEIVPDWMAPVEASVP